MVGLMWNELFRLQEKYSQYIHRGEDTIRRVFTSNEQRIEYESKYSVLQELGDAFQAVWDNSEGYGIPLDLTRANFEKIGEVKVFLDRKDGDVWYEWCNRHFDTMAQVLDAQGLLPKYTTIRARNPMSEELD